MTDGPLTETAFKPFIQDNPLCLVYFSGPDCAVCEQLKPKLFKLLSRQFPQLVFAEVDCSREKTLVAALGVFTVPTVIAYIEGGEAFRHTRSFSPAQVAAQLQRPYRIFMQQ